MKRMKRTDPVQAQEETLEQKLSILNFINSIKHANKKQAQLSHVST
jgi:hypothetical protein